MKYTLEVCLVALALTTISIRATAQSPAVSAPPSSAASWNGTVKLTTPDAVAVPAQAMQQGISVQLPVANTAVPMADAEQEDSLIVTVTDDGTVYFGVDPVNPAVLAEEVRKNLSNRPEKKLYIKADARTQYANVLMVLEALRSAGVDTTVLLSDQRASSTAGTLVPPYGLAVRVGPLQPSGSGTTMVQVLDSGQRWPALKINGEEIPWPSLQSRLDQVSQNPSKRLLPVIADGSLPFSDVMDVTDVSRSTGDQVVLVTPEL
jgi:biopolymer transport protein ExbD